MAAWLLYGKAYANLLGGEVAADALGVDYLSDTIRVMLTTSTYAPNRDTHETKADVTNEVTGTGYTARGTALTAKTITYTAADSWAAARANSTVYALGDVVRPATVNGHLYRAIIAGTSGSTVPTFPTVSGDTVVDGGVKWAEIGSGIVVIDADDPTWAASTITARRAVCYKDTGTDTTSSLLAVLDFGSDQVSSNGSFVIQLSQGQNVNLGIYDHATL